MTTWQFVKEIAPVVIYTLFAWVIAMLLIDDINMRLRRRRMKKVFQQLVMTPPSTGEPRPLTIAEGRESIGYDPADEEQHANPGNGADNEKRI